MSGSRFSIWVYRTIAFTASTYDEIYSKILEDHVRRTKACGFRIDFGVAFIGRDEEIPYSPKYHIVDHHEEI